MITHDVRDPISSLYAVHDKINAIRWMALSVVVTSSVSIIANSARRSGEPFDVAVAVVGVTVVSTVNVGNNDDCNSSLEIMPNK
jgi:hypothetical protein